MNKKVIGIIIGVVVVIAIAVGIIIVTNGNKLEEVKLPLQIDFLERTVSATIGYPKDNGIVVEDTERENNKILKNENENYKLDIRIANDTTYNSNKEYDSKKEGYEELQFNDLNGYIMKGKYEYKIKALLEEASSTSSIYLTMTFKPIKSQDSNIEELYKLNDVQEILKSIKYDNGEDTKEETKKKIDEKKEKEKTSNYGEFKSRDRKDGTSDPKGLIFIPKYTSYDNSKYVFEQVNNINPGVQSYLKYQGETSYLEKGVVDIEVSVIPDSGTYENMQEYIQKKGDLYTWSKTTIAGKEYDTYIFGNGSVDSKYSKYITGAFMVGNKVISFSYHMYKEVPDQDLGDKLFTHVINNIEYSKDFNK